MQIQALDSRRHIRDQADDRVYRFSPAIPRLPGATAALAYLAPVTERPTITCTSRPPEQPERTASIGRDRCGSRTRARDGVTTRHSRRRVRALGRAERGDEFH
jgi:hypothetical protein